MRLIDADDLLKDARDISEYAPGCNWFVVDVEDIENAPTVDAISVKDIMIYLQSVLNKWKALGDRRFEPANMWGYNFIMTCFDDLERRKNEINSSN